MLIELFRYIVSKIISVILITSFFRYVVKLSSLAIVDVSSVILKCDFRLGKVGLHGSCFSKRQYLQYLVHTFNNIIYLTIKMVENSF